jgi:hypothetical protein
MAPDFGRQAGNHHSDIKQKSCRYIQHLFFNNNRRSAVFIAIVDITIIYGEKIVEYKKTEPALTGATEKKTGHRLTLGIQVTGRCGKLELKFCRWEVACRSIPPLPSSEASATKVA